MREFPFIGAFGVELEGGWNEPYPEHYLWDGIFGDPEPDYPGCEDDNGERCHECDACERWDAYQDNDGDSDGRYRHGDGSVSTRADWNGEIATPPYTSFSKFKADYRAVYPNAVNSSCGMHLHVSVNRDAGDPVALYSSMMDPRFKKFILRGIKRWAKKANVREGSAFWRRLEGSNTYCRDTWEPDAQARMRHRDSVRYSMFNFCYNCEGRGTLEFRFLPMFENKSLGEGAIHQLLRLTNAYLKAAAKQTFKHTADVGEVEVPEFDNPDIEETVWST